MAARSRTIAPATVLALGVALGQGVVWFFGGIVTAVIVVCLGAWLCRYASKGRGALAIAVILGVLSSIPAVIREPTLVSGSDVVIAGTVDGPVRRRVPGEVSFDVVSSMTHNPARIRCRVVDLPWRNSAHLETGDLVWLRGSCTSVHRPFNPFSWEGWLWRRGVQAECKVRYLSRQEHHGFRWIQRARNAILERVREAAGDSRGTALLLSMALGYQDLLSAPVERAFMKLGLTHLLVVSGYQVSLVFGCLVSLLSLAAGIIGTRILSRSAITVIGFAAALGYVCLIGLEMSAVRALIAAGCVCGQLLTERGGKFSQRWGFALLCMQLIWPWCVYEIGVVLTFSALLGIGVGAASDTRHKIISYAWVTFVVWVFTSCVVVLWSGAFSPLGVLINFLLAAPWSILNCTVGMIGVGLAFGRIPGAGELLGVVAWINTAISQLLIDVSEYPLAGGTFELLASRIVIAAALTATAGYITVRSVMIRRETLEWSRGGR